MYRNFIAAALAGLLSLAPVTAKAADQALILLQQEVNRDWYNADRFGFDVLVRQLRTEGFEVTIEDGSVLASRAAVWKFWTQLQPSDRAVIVAFGQVATSPRDSWLAMQNAESPDAISIAGRGISLGVLSDVLADAPGRALLVIGRTNNQLRLRRGLSDTFEQFDVPQGVSVVSGPAISVFPFVSDKLLTQKTPMREALKTAPPLVTGFGFLPQRPFVGAFRGVRRPSGDAGFWQAAEAIGSEAAYKAYLEKHPGGTYAALAQERLNKLEADRTARAQQAEAALALDRAERRVIQRDLTRMGFDTNGIDGVFGRGSRSAIRRWQSAADLEPTGYLNAKQLAHLRQLALARQHELEAEDRAFWVQTGQGETESGLQAYLQKYPQGVFAETARNALAARDADRQEAARAAERAAWQTARSDGSAAALRAFLKDYPDGVFAPRARQRLSELQAGSTGNAAVERARAEEQEVARTKVVRLLIEQRLSQLGMKPGRPDGVFDKNTRAALSRFQRGRNLPVTGYVSRATISGLLGALK